jgi:hypothetical protein
MLIEPKLIKIKSTGPYVSPFRRGSAAQAHRCAPHLRTLDLAVFVDISASSSALLS